ncbi:HEAT repeat domain-containing protein [bacterium]|nr:HEAT repeat domain-containing protein [bacterium]
MIRFWQKQVLTISWFRKLLPLLLGLIICQTLAVIHLYYVTRTQLSRFHEISRANEIFIPGYTALTHSSGAIAIFKSALLITMSLGVGISLITIFVLYAARTPGIFWKVVCYSSFPIWIYCLYLLNSVSICWFSSSYFLIIPIFIWFLDRKIPGEPIGYNLYPFNRFQLIIALLISATWVGFYDNSSLVSIRDHLLLSNSVGEKLSDYYYDNSFLVAAAIQSQKQKPVKTYYLTSEVEPSLKREIDAVLTSLSYLKVSQSAISDLIISSNGTSMGFSTPIKQMTSVSIPDFRANPAEALRDFSDKGDYYKFFRLALFISLLVTVPICCTLLLYLALMMVLQKLMTPNRAIQAATLITGLILLFTSYKLRPYSQPSYNISNPTQGLSSANQMERIAALKDIIRQKADINKFGSYNNLLHSQYTADRLWLATALAHVHHPKATSELTGLLNDPSPNVVCKAMLSLGQRGDVIAAGLMANIIKTTTSLYPQQCAYLSLQN